MKSSLIIVPTIALQSDLYNRFIKSGLPVSKWANETQLLSSKTVIAVAASLSSLKFKTWVKMNGNKLATLFFDEVRPLLTSIMVGALARIMGFYPQH